MIRFDVTQVQSLQQHLARVSNTFVQDRQRALSSTRRASGTQVKRSVASVYSLPQRRIDQGLTITAIDPRDLSFKIIGSRKVIGLQNFRNRGTNRDGVKVQVLKGSAFKAPGRGTGGYRSKAFYAKGRIWQREDSNRLPVRTLSGPSVADMISKTVVIKEVTDFATSKIGNELQRKLTAALKNG